MWKEGVCGTHAQGMQVGGSTIQVDGGVLDVVWRSGKTPMTGERPSYLELEGEQ